MSTSANETSFTVFQFSTHSQFTRMYLITFNGEFCTYITYILTYIFIVQSVPMLTPSFFLLISFCRSSMLNWAVLRSVNTFCSRVLICTQFLHDLPLV
jgi:hypothetical protein